MILKQVYGDSFYQNRLQATNMSANVVLDLLLTVIPRPSSAVDLGCGVGAWLAVLREKGVNRLLGMDGPWVNRDYLAIEPAEFKQVDFNAPLPSAGRFDLAISLEVAEHLPSAVADQFVAHLVGSADFVLFSAAPPLQGGTHHINEQPLEYWLEKFATHGYRGIDCIRPPLWTDRRVAPWYRQNIVLLVRSNRLSELTPSAMLTEPGTMLHPEIFLQRLMEGHTVRGAWKLLRRAIKRRVKSWFTSTTN